MHRSKKSVVKRRDLEGLDARQVAIVVKSGASLLFAVSVQANLSGTDFLLPVLLLLAPRPSSRRHSRVVGGRAPRTLFWPQSSPNLQQKQHGRPREVRPDWAHSQFSEVYTIEDQHHDVQVHRPIGHPPGLLRRGGRRPHPHEAAKDSGPRDRGAALEGRGTIHTTDASCQVPMFHGRTNTVAPIAR